MTDDRMETITDRAAIRASDEHTDAVARVVHRFVESHDRDEMVADLLTSTDPAVHAAMLDALVRAGVLTEERAPISRGMEHHHWQQRWDGQHTDEGRRYATRWEVAP